MCLNRTLSWWECVTGGFFISRLTKKQRMKEEEARNNTSSRIFSSDLLHQVTTPKTTSAMQSGVGVGDKKQSELGPSGQMLIRATTLTFIRLGTIVLRHCFFYIYQDPVPIGWAVALLCPRCQSSTLPFYNDLPEVTLSLPLTFTPVENSCLNRCCRDW